MSLNLLPKTSHDFGQKDYWNSFFQKRAGKAFEWYGEYPELCGQLHKYIKNKDDILMVGCGNSKLSQDLYDVGCHQITNIDISPLVIQQMNDANKTRTKMTYVHMDATQMRFSDDQFSVVLDKGTLDALYTDDTDETRAIVTKYLCEIARVLRTGGRYVCVSLLQEHIVRRLVDFFPPLHYMFRVIRCAEAEQKTAEASNDGTAMPVFFVVATKFQKLPFAVLEVCMSGDKMSRVQSAGDVVDSVLSVQKAALVCNGLHRGSIADMNEVSMDLFRPDEQIPRFTVHILDQRPKRGNGRFAIFIVPQGRETEWLFSTPQGRKKLLASAQHDRLAIVSMHRGQIYTTWEDVKFELSESIKNLAPSGVSHQQQIPYLSLGSEVGNRETIFKGRSDLSGDYIVEEITGEDGKILRRLVFLSNQNVIQSEALVKVVRNKNKQVIKKVIDHTYLACQHHLYMTVGVNLLIAGHRNSVKEPVEVAVIGLGGGGLCSFIRETLKDVVITAVDIDAAMLTVASNYFGLTSDDRLKVVIDDGLVFLDKAANAGTTYRAVLFDVDSKDASLGMSCPPRPFLEPAVIDNVKKCIGTGGVFVLNLVCRDEKQREAVLDELRASFHSVCAYKLDEDVNEIVYCRTAPAYEPKQWHRDLEQAARNLNDRARALQKAAATAIANGGGTGVAETRGRKSSQVVEDLVEVEDFLKSLTL